MKVITTRFGELDLEDSKVITIPDGMVGFNDRKFVILNPENGGPFFWLQSVENPDLAFVIADPAQFVPDYQVKLSREEYEKLQLESGDEEVMLCVVTMSPNPRQITINLQGPIVVNPARMIARQIVLEGNHETRHLLFAPREAAIAPKNLKTLPTLAKPMVPSLYSGMALAQACC